MRHFHHQSSCQVRPGLLLDQSLSSPSPCKMNVHSSKHKTLNQRNKCFSAKEGQWKLFVSRKNEFKNRLFVLSVSRHLITVACYGRTLELLYDGWKDHRCKFSKLSKGNPKKCRIEEDSNLWSANARSSVRIPFSPGVFRASFAIAEVAQLTTVIFPSFISFCSEVKIWNFTYATKITLEL